MTFNLFHQPYLLYPADLIYSRDNLAFRDETFQIWNGHVAHANGSTLSSFDELFHGFPGIDVCPFAFVQEMTISVSEDGNGFPCRRKWDWPVHQVDCD